VPFVNKSRRLKNYNYSQNGHYFVTTVVKNRTPCFGKIINQKMVLNSYGQIVYKQWLWLGQNFSFIRLDEFTVMPDHFHGVMEIGNIIDYKIKSLSEIIGAFKTTSSKLIHQFGLTDFKWQKSFYDHIIRDDESLNRIRFYIKNNAIHHS